MIAKRPLLPMLRDALLVAAVAVLTVQALRRFCGDRYMVPSDSMQPILHGDPDHGDVVFVGKLARASAQRRHDLVVVQHPDHDGQQLVKRIASRGDDTDACWIDIREGDVWLGPDRQRLRRETKDPLAARPMRVVWAEWPAASPALVAPLDLTAAAARDGAMVLPPLVDPEGAARERFHAEARVRRRADHAPGVLPRGFLGTMRAVDASFVDVTGRRGRAGEDVGVVDCGMEIGIAGPVDALLATIDGRHQALTFCWRADRGSLELWCDGVTVESATLSPCEHAHRVEFGLLDDRAFFVVDGRADALAVFARRPEWPGNERIDAPRTHVHVAVLGGAPLRLTHLRVWRDVFYWRERIAGFPGEPGDWPRFVPAGSWFLLGDNTFDSRDSRHFDARPAASFLGRPLLVLGPWPRGRWLLP